MISEKLESRLVLSNVIVTVLFEEGILLEELLDAGDTADDAADVDASLHSVDVPAANPSLQLPASLHIVDAAAVAGRWR
jgi:hypothetical protein